MEKNLFNNFKWDYKPEFTITENSLTIKAHPESDYFISPLGDKKSLDAAFFYTETGKDFILKAKVTHAFKSLYDACVLMVMGADTCWAKLCFELSDKVSHSVVSVVTNGCSDDANGVKIQGNTVYLQIAKKGNVIAFHYSTDGKIYEKVRLFKLPLGEKVKAGFVAQSPTGNGGDFIFENIEMSFNEIKDIRKGC